MTTARTKSHRLPTDSEISIAFGGFNFGDVCRTEDAKARTLAYGLLQVASGFSCGSSMCEILLRLGLANRRLGSPYVDLNAYGRRCILAAHKRIVLGEFKDANRDAAACATP